MAAGRRLAAVGRFDALILVSGIWFLGKFTRYAFPPLFGTFRAEYGVSNGTLGALFTGLMLAYAGMQFPSGALGDRFGSGRVIAGGAAVLSAAALLLFATQAFPALVVAMVLIGVGTGAHKTVAISLLAGVYPSRTGRMLGLMDTAGELAGVAAPVAVVAAVATVGWSPVFLAIGGAGIGLSAAFRRRGPRRASGASTREDADASPDPRRYLVVLREPRFVAFVLVIVGFSFAWNGLTAFLPLYLTSAKGLSPTRAGLLYGGLFAVSVVQPVTGALSDRVGRYPVLIATLGIATVGVVGLLAGTTTLGLAALVGVVGIGSHGFRPARDSHLMDVLPSAAAGGTLGIVRTIMMGAGAVAPAVVGVLSETGGFGVAFGVLAGALAVGVGTVAVLAVVERGYSPA